jgi:stage IV sporulation protein FB
MLLQEPGQSPYDLRFHLLGFPVRISWSFWLAGVIFGFSLVRSLDGALGLRSPGMLPLLLLWNLSLLVSILIHELGHALAFRRNGMNASIVLYHFGGLAIPTSSYSPDRFHGQLTPKQDIWISFAGPLAQLVSAVIVLAAVRAAGYRLTVLEWMPGPFYKIPGVLDGKELAMDSVGLFVLVMFYVFPSVLWAILNLVPVWPLDGGHISSSIIQLFGGNKTQALWVSVIAAGLMALYGFSNDQRYMGFLFLVLGVTNFQALQQSGGYR